MDMLGWSREWRKDPKDIEQEVALFRKETGYGFWFGEVVKFEGEGWTVGTGRSRAEQKDETFKV